MENFITGYPGHEHQHRAAMLQVLGQEKYEFFFDKFLEYFFMEEDAKFFASLGLNCLRLPFNYHHFEDDMNPRVLKKGGFKHLDRVIELVGIIQSSTCTNIERKTNSAPNTTFTRFSICTPFPAPKPRTGILTTTQITPPSGIIKIIRIVPSGYVPNRHSLPRQPLDNRLQSHQRTL